MAEKNTSMGGLITNGLLSENPLLRLGLGICPALAVTTRAANGLGLGLTTCCVLVCTSLLASLLGYVTSEKGRVAVFMLLSALFAAIAQMVLKGWFPALSAELGIFVPLIAVNSLILCRAEDFAANNNPAAALADAVGMGLGYTAALTVVGIVRELIGKGAIFGKAILPAGFEPMVMMALPAGGFLACGLLMGICNAVLAKSKKKEGAKA